MSNDLKKSKKDGLSKLVEKFKNEQNIKEENQELKKEIQELKYEHNRVLKIFGAEDENEYINICMEMIGKTVKGLLEENENLNNQLKEKELLMKKVQKLNDEQKRNIEELKSNNGIKKIKNERGAGRKSKLTDKEIEKILKDRECGTTIRNIAIFNNCSVGLVHKIISEHNKAKSE